MQNNIQRLIQVRYRRYSTRQRQGKLPKRLKQILQNIPDSGIQWRLDGHGFTIYDPVKFYKETAPQILDIGDQKKFQKLLREYLFTQKDDNPPHKSFYNESLDRYDIQKKVFSRRQYQQFRIRLAQYEQKMRLYQMAEKRKQIRKTKSKRAEGQNVSNQNIPNQESSEDSQFIPNPENMQESEDNWQYNQMSQEEDISALQTPLNNQNNESIAFIKMLQASMLQDLQASDREKINDKVPDEEDQNLTREIVQLRQKYETLRAEVKLLKDLKLSPDMRFEDVVISNSESDNFRYSYFQKLLQYRRSRLSKLITKAKSPHVVKQKLPFTYYFAKQMTLSNQSNPRNIKWKEVSPDIKETQWQIKFTPNSLQLDHSGVKVDFNEFFNYDWSQFEVMKFENCRLTTSNWVRICRNALDYLPNLKILYLNNNEISFVSKNDLFKFVQVRKIELKNNKLDSQSQSQIQNYVEEKGPAVIVIN